MAVDATLTPLVSGYNLAKIQTNFDALETALLDAVSRSGTTPNTMSADFDMNSNDILNVGNIDVTSITVSGETLVVDELLAQGPAGADGADGADGVTPSVSLGTVSTGAAGTSVIISNSGVAPDVVLNFTIPRGDTGASGAGSGDLLAAQNLNDLASKPTAFANIKVAASDSATGVVELATNAEGITGTDTARAVTPAVLEAVMVDRVDPEFVIAKTQVIGINSQVGTTYTLATGDAGKLVELSNAAAITLTVPTNATVALPVNTVIDIIQQGAGQVSVAAAVGVTIRSSGSKLKLTGQYSGASLIKRGTNEWYLVGDIAA